MSSPDYRHSDPAADLRPQVSIVVLTYKEGAHLERCLEAVHANVPRSVPHEVILLVNGLGLGPVAGMQRRFPDVRVVDSPTNLGFAGGCNRAVGSGRGHY